MAEQFVALRNLELNGIRAFAKGDPVPADNYGVTGDEHNDAPWVFGEDYADAESEAAEEAVFGPQRPANSASKAAWVDYAEALHNDGNGLGLTREDAEAMNRDDLIAHLDGQRG